MAGISIQCRVPSSQLDPHACSCTPSKVGTHPTKTNPPVGCYHEPVDRCAADDQARVALPAVRQSRLERGQVEGACTPSQPTGAACFRRVSSWAPDGPNPPLSSSAAPSAGTLTVDHHRRSGTARIGGQGAGLKPGAKANRHRCEDLQSAGWTNRLIGLRRRLYREQKHLPPKRQRNSTGAAAMRRTSRSASAGSPTVTDAQLLVVMLGARLRSSVPSALTL